MEQNKDKIIKDWLSKADKALKSASNNINSDDLETAQNRVYYSMFYAVKALAAIKT